MNIYFKRVGAGLDQTLLLTCMIKYISKFLANSLHSCGKPQFVYKTRFRRSENMPKNRKAPTTTLRFRLMSMAGLVIEFCCMMYAAAFEGILAAFWGVIPMIAILMWVTDVCANKSTKLRNENIVLVTVLTIMIRCLCASKYYSIALALMIIIEFIFMFAIAEQTNKLD